MRRKRRAIVDKSGILEVSAVCSSWANVSLVLPENATRNGKTHAPGTRKKSGSAANTVPEAANTSLTNGVGDIRNRRG
jgi:hypothetical protein